MLKFGRRPGYVSSQNHFSSAQISAPETEIAVRNDCVVASDQQRHVFGGTLRVAVAGVDDIVVDRFQVISAPVHIVTGHYEQSGWIFLTEVIHGVSEVTFSNQLGLKTSLKELAVICSTDVNAYLIFEKKQTGNDDYKN